MDDYHFNYFRKNVSGHSYDNIQSRQSRGLQKQWRYEKNDQHITSILNGVGCHISTSTRLLTFSSSVIQLI